MRSRGWCWWRRAGVARRSVNDDARVGVVAHEFCIGGLELADEVVQFFVQRHVCRVKRIAQLLRDGLAAGAGLPGFLHDATERGDGRLQRGQLRGGHAVGGELNQAATSSPFSDQTTLPPTIVATFLPFSVQPKNGLFLDLLAECSRS